MAAVPDGGEWTLVLPRRRRRSATQKSKTLNPKPHTTLELQPSPNPQIEESKLMNKMQLTLSNLESSSFYRTLIAQIQTPQLLSNFSRALSSSSASFQSHINNKMQMVIYGIGSIDSYDAPRLQLSLAILLSREFNWMIEGRIEVFDPVLSEVEARVMEALGCTVLTVDEQGRREAELPTLFFMPHCEAELYNNLLEANWRAERLNRMVVFGNSFGRYHSFVSEFKDSVVGKRSISGHVMEARRFVEEIGIDTVSEDFFRAFHDTSWHFFCLDADVRMEMDVKQEGEGK